MIRIKLLAVTLLAVPMFSFAIFRDVPAMAASDDPAAEYKAKCVACHSATASKFFDPAKDDAELVQITLQGRKGDKPPYMPGYEAKGMTTDGAKGLVMYMKSLRAK